MGCPFGKVVDRDLRVVCSLIRYSAVVIRWPGIVLGTLRSGVHTHRELTLENLVLRQQLPVWKARRPGIHTRHEMTPPASAPFEVNGVARETRDAAVAIRKTRRVESLRRR